MVNLRLRYILNVNVSEELCKNVICVNERVNVGNTE